MITIFRPDVEQAEAYCQAMKEIINSRGWPARVVEGKAFHIDWQCSDHFDAIRDLPTYEEWEQNNG